jgi:nucleoside-diphosphate-sugar epimerase
MNTLVVGASGATGKLLVDQLLKAGHKVKIIVRSKSKIPQTWNNNDKLTIIRKNISEVGVDEMAEYLESCHAMACCLGHNLTRKGIWGKPKRLVADAVRLLCEAVAKNSPDKPIKLVLMNTAGNVNKDLNEPVSFGEKMAFGLIRLLLPPQLDNEKAADYLRVNIGQNQSQIEWVVVRPDTLINNENVTEYSLHISPTSSALFNPGKTSRINVAHFMANLITNDSWNNWKGKMPVIYNSAN